MNQPNPLTNQNTNQYVGTTKGQIVPFTNHTLTTNLALPNYGNIAPMQNDHNEAKKYVSDLEIASFPSGASQYLSSIKSEKEDFEQSSQILPAENHFRFLSHELVPINSSNSDVSNGSASQSSKGKKEKDDEYSENSALREDDDELDFSVGSVGSMPSVPSVGSINAMVEEMKETTTNTITKNEKKIDKSITHDPSHIVTAQKKNKLENGYNDFRVAKDDEIEDAEIDALFMEEDVKDEKESNSSTHDQIKNQNDVENKGDYNANFGSVPTKIEPPTNDKLNISQPETTTKGLNTNENSVIESLSPKTSPSSKQNMSLIETDAKESNSKKNTHIMTAPVQLITIAQSPTQVLSSTISKNSQTETPKNSSLITQISQKQSTTIHLETKHLHKPTVEDNNDAQNHKKDNHKSKKRCLNWNSNSFVSLISNSTSIQNERESGMKKRKKKKKKKISINVDSFLGLGSTTQSINESQSSFIQNSSNLSVPSSPFMFNMLSSPNQAKTSKMPGKESLSDDELEKIMADSSNIDTRLIQITDRQTVTDFVWLLMNQVKLTHADLSDCKRSQRVKSMQVGYSGFTCRHCSKFHNDGYNSSRICGRFFSSAPDNITAAVTTAFLGHLQKCPHVPKEIILALHKVKKTHTSQISSLAVGSQRRFIHVFWNRLRSYDTVLSNKSEHMNVIKKKEPMKKIMIKKEHATRHKADDKKNEKKSAPPRVTSITPLVQSSMVLQPNLPIKFFRPPFVPTSPPVVDYESFYKNDEITLKVIKETKATPPKGMVSVFAAWLDSIHTYQITDYVFLVMRQANICHVEHQDFHRGKRSKILEIGLGGLCCKDCKGGRSFPTSPDNIVTGINVTFFNHLLKCHFVSTEYKHAVTAAKKAHPTQMSLLPYGSQRKFVQVVFKALRDNDSDKVNGNAQTIKSAVNNKTIHTNYNNGLTGVGPYPTYNNFPMIQGKSQNFLTTNPSLIANPNKKTFYPKQQTTPFISSGPPNHQAPIMIAPTNNLKKNASSSPINTYAKDATSFVSSITLNNSAPLINAPTTNLVVPKNMSTVNELDIKVPASDIKLQHYAFMQMPSKWWVCKYCRMVPLDFRSEGSLYSYKPTEKEIRKHRFICHEDNLHMELVIEALNGMMSTINDISVDILAQPLFKYIVLELVGGNKSLCELFTTEILKNVDKKNDENGSRTFLDVKMKTSGMWSYFPKTVNQDAVYHALDAFKKANAGICIKKIINNKHFRQYVSCLTPFWFDTIVWEKICDRLTQVDMINNENENTFLV